MPDYVVRATAHFEEDLVSAYRYYQRQAGANSASRFLDEYDLTVSRLQSMPTAAVKIGDTGLHWCPIGSYTAVFSVDAEQKVVVLNRLFYMSSDWKRRILEHGERDAE
ncbi:MAG: type II toxin-antitoxin system RelE/ParE family toxin [Coriobacteriaceae bacterium]|nr:type II toxin-antitoxin system RelE/ParE family toxin [Coriobacteriaceae bacterium]